MPYRIRPLIALAFPALIVAACGSDVNDTLTSGSSGNNGSNGGFGGGDTDGGNNNSSGNVACAAQESAAERKPVKLLIALDQSGSMGGNENNQKWVPVTTALKAFLTESRSSGIAASMRLFPTSGQNDTPAFKCTPENYSVPNVPMTDLPNAAPFSAKLVANPSFKHTPTRAVLRATVADAKVVAAANPNAKVAIVLITDGAPAGCEDTPMGNDIDDVANEVKGTKATIPTYVIGVGAVSNLNKVAQAGGPRDAFIVALNDPSATQQQFFDAIDEIRGASISCEVTIPSPPTGQTLDPTKVNVNYTPTGKAAQALGYDEKCAGDGWHYDDKNAPKQVVLCPSTCAIAKADPTAKLALEFGCETRAARVL